jgi:bifunctional non-homologous end joining protein LigD
MPARTATRAPRRKPRTAKRPGSLRLYDAKRNLAASGEPAGGPRPSVPRSAIHRYVIQKHDATRLHYDFRLEMEGVLRSWAVPKGLPTKAGERALAVEVEDHPIEYGKFEGVIPEGNYGAGTVMLWDRGNYTVAEEAPEEAYRAGKIHLALAGEKCVGEWTLVRMRPRPGERQTNWLIIKNSGPSHEAPMTGNARDLSVLSGRTLDEISGGAKPKPKAKSRAKSGAAAGSVKKKVPASPPADEAKRVAAAAGRPAEFIPPMKALSIDTVPGGKWRLEVKLDGYRAVAVINRGAVELWSRNHKPLTQDYPEVVEALKRIRCTNAVIDGEIVALDEQGRSRFQLLQGRSLPGVRPTIAFYVFDLLHQDGHSFLNTPIEERQSALQKLIGRKNDVIRLSPVFETDPTDLLEAVRQQGLEGIIAKKPGSPYEPDRRSGTWLKCKVHGEQEFVIGGFTPPKNSRPYFGAVLVGYYEGDRLLYAGKVGSGYNHALLKSLHAEFMKRQIASTPFANLPTPRTRFGTGMTAGEMRKVTWIKPELVCQVRFTEWTDDGMLRHPVFLGLRRDKSAKEVVREASPIAGGEE